MVSLVQPEPLDLNDMTPAAARTAIRDLLAKESAATRRVYSALAQKVWTLLVERHFDPEIRDWSALLGNVRTRLQKDDQAAAERVSALADLVGASVTFAELSPAKAVAERPRARAILDHLAKHQGFMKRQALLNALGIGSSHLSNILTQLQAHDLVRRRGNGKQAEFEITRLGRQLLEGRMEPGPETPLPGYHVDLIKALSPDRAPAPSLELSIAKDTFLIWSTPSGGSHDVVGWGDRPPRAALVRIGSTAGVFAYRETVAEPAWPL